jgi:hypothetical protein
MLNSMVGGGGIGESGDGGPRGRNQFAAPGRTGARDVCQTRVSGVRLAAC